MHSEAWVGAVNLSGEYVKKLRYMFKCSLCHSNKLTLPSCPFMKHQISKKKVQPDSTDTSGSPSQETGAVNHVTTIIDSIDTSDSDVVVSTSLPTIHENDLEALSSDDTSPVVFVTHSSKIVFTI